MRAIVQDVTIAPLPNAPDGFEEPTWRHDTFDVLTAIDRTGLPPIDGEGSPSNLIDRFVLKLLKDLHVLRNIAPFALSTDEVGFMEELPTQIYAVVTNDQSYADWCRDWNGNLVEIRLDSDHLYLTAHGATERFTAGDLQSATTFAAEATQVFAPKDEFEGPLDAGVALLKPIGKKELATVEPILAQLWRALDAEWLTEPQQAQILAMAKLLEGQALDAIPGETERWKIVGPLRAILKYLAKELPRDALAWWKLIELLQQIEWVALASELPG